MSFTKGMLPSVLTKGPIEGYIPAAPLAPAVRPTVHLQRVLGIIPTANKTGNSLLLYSLLQPSTLCNPSLGTLFSFFEPPSLYPCVLGLGVGVMGNVGYVAIPPTVYGYQVCFLYNLVHLKGLVKWCSPCGHA